MDRLQKTEFILVLIILAINLGFLIYILNIGNISGFFLLEKEELKAPHDFIQEEEIIADNTGVFIKINNPVLSRYTDSESMTPILEEYATGIGFKPVSEEEIHIGDIVSFWQNNKMIVHRVIELGEDEDGVFFVTKGDNNNFNDEKIRFEDIDSVLVAVIY